MKCNAEESGSSFCNLFEVVRSGIESLGLCRKRNAVIQLADAWESDLGDTSAVPSTLYPLACDPLLFATFLLAITCCQCKRKCPGFPDSSIYTSRHPPND